MLACFDLFLLACLVGCMHVCLLGCLVACLLACLLACLRYYLYKSHITCKSISQVILEVVSVAALFWPFTARGTMSSASLLRCIRCALVTHTTCAILMVHTPSELFGLQCCLALTSYHQPIFHSSSRPLLLITRWFMIMVPSRTKASK